MEQFLVLLLRLENGVHFPLVYPLVEEPLDKIQPPGSVLAYARICHSAHRAIEHVHNLLAMSAEDLEQWIEDEHALGPAPQDVIRNSRLRVWSHGSSSNLRILAASLFMHIRTWHDLRVRGEFQLAKAVRQIASRVRRQIETRWLVEEYYISERNDDEPPGMGGVGARVPRGPMDPIWTRPNCERAELPR